MPEVTEAPAGGARLRWLWFAAILVALPGLAVRSKLDSDPQLAASDPYMVNLQPDRLAGILAAVPSNAVMGYVTDLAPASTAYLATFNSARFALAPRLLVFGADQPFVLGNFSRPADFAAFGREKGLELVQDFGNGAVLFRRTR
jgi:hypothetical protein